ncbi:MAG TPA: FAD-binding protein [Clostridiales bacterium]|nr:FAD-binding protein [Clostridiales bacterium]
MDKRTVNLEGIDFDVYSLNTIVVGTGAAGFNAADTLYSLGQRDIAILTEGVDMGTSRNTGSDKQTYYKLTLAGDEPDSIQAMAQTLFDGGSMHGDIALVEAALSAKCFYKLVNIGVPFPHNRYGEYVGYKTDHDPRQRATSCGPLTSKFMTEKLEAQVKAKDITIFDRYLAIGILTSEDKESIGLIALDMDNLDSPNMGITLFNCTNIIYATGGPAGMYLTSVYPESQIGASGIAYEAGAKGVNLTESQYGIASTKFRWNLSGTYQQVIPRYVSTDKDGRDEREFLEEYFDEPGKMLDAIFLKGYQWPFDPRKVANYGSSLIDILVYNETQIKGRRVFLDFTRNPSWGSKDGELDFSLLGKESYEYLKNSQALFGTPIDRLAKMNEPAIELYKSNGIDITREYLEIDVCAQHNNGGLLGNIWYESNLKHLFPVGEVNGTFGIYRPGGSALNSTQVGSFRAAQYISENYTQPPLSVEEFLKKAKDQIIDRVEIARGFKANMGKKSNVLDIRKRMQKRMTRAGAHIRSLNECVRAIEECSKEWKDLISNTVLSSFEELPDAFRNRDILLTQYVYLNAIKVYIESGGRSRGSYLVYDDKGKLPIEGLSEEFKFVLDDGSLTDKVAEVGLEIEDGGQLRCNVEWKPVRPIPKEDNWFENVWNDYRSGNIIK